MYLQYVSGKHKTWLEIICRPSYVIPNGVVTGIKVVHPMFRGYSQQVKVVENWLKKCC